MKHMRFLFLGLAGLLLVAGCKKDKKSDTDQLRGTWEATSYTEDGTELIPVFVQSLTIRNDEIIGGEGDFRWTITFNPVFGNPTQIINGRYTVNEARKEIQYTDMGEALLFEYSLDGNNLTLEGNVDGTAVRIRLRKA
jgi:hypothetical protein